MINKDEELDKYADYVFEIVKTYADSIRPSENGHYFTLELLFGGLIIDIYDTNKVTVNKFTFNTKADPDGYGIIYNFAKGHIAEADRKREERLKKAAMYKIDEIMNFLKEEGSNNAAKSN